VNSFSFKRGYPDDEGGHGGGYVFDCRGLPNPGRHLEYRTLCGRDAGVVEYIERCSEAHSYWKHVRPLVAGQVEEYLRRGFSSLTISFGCTGGQHRSVYFAERLAAHLRHEFPQVNVRLAHREEGTWPKDTEPTEPDSESRTDRPSTRKAGSPDRASSAQQAAGERTRSGERTGSADGAAERTSSDVDGRRSRVGPRS
jgi:hypothetical protein